MTERDKFIIDTSVKIYAAMFSNTEKEPSTQVAIKSAIKLWENLRAEDIDPQKMESDSDKIYI